MSKGPSYGKIVSTVTLSSPAKKIEPLKPILDTKSLPSQVSFGWKVDQIE